jgi:hypothetical protein
VSLLHNAEKAIIAALADRRDRRGRVTAKKIDDGLQVGSLLNQVEGGVISLLMVELAIGITHSPSVS